MHHHIQLMQCWGGTQGFVCARQVLYQLNYLPDPLLTFRQDHSSQWKHSRHLGMLHSTTSLATEHEMPGTSLYWLYSSNRSQRLPNVPLRQNPPCRETESLLEQLCPFQILSHSDEPSALSSALCLMPGCSTRQGAEA